MLHQDNILTKIIADKRVWLEQHKLQQPLTEFQDKVNRSQRDFYQALRQGNPAFILECKKASPSKGLIRQDFDPSKIAKIYAPYASAVSVLTDEKYFQGSFHYLKMVSDQLKQPVLCKDFIIDPYQIYLARYYQADAILLMLSVLDDQQYQTLATLASQLNMGILTEVSTEEEVKRAIHLKARVVGINNRNLRDLSINLDRTRQFAHRFADETVIISESGIYDHQQVQELSQYVNGFLIGSSLMSAENLAHAVKRIIYGEHKICGLTRVEDAQAAYQAGALYGGLIFAKQSPRLVSIQQAETLVSQVDLKWVGVFVNESIEQIVKLAKSLKLSAIQLHGQEDQSYITTLRQALAKNCQIWKAVSVKHTLPQLALTDVDIYLLDHGAGGSGQTFDWSMIKDLPLDKVMIAGGLSIENVQQALGLKSKGLDFNSGVESSPGIKDQQKISALFHLIRHC